MPPRRLLAALLAVAATGAALPAAASASGGALVISQATAVSTVVRPAHVSVLNRSSQPINLDGLSVQFRGVGGLAWATIATLPAVEVPPGRSFLVAFGDPRVDPNPTYADLLSLGLFFGSSGTLAIVRGDVLLSCGSPAECAGDTRVADLVGYGNAPIAEGSPVAAQAPDPPGGIARRLGGCLDNDANSNDVEALGSIGPVTLQSGTGADCAGNSTAAPVASCGPGTLSVGAGKVGVRTVTGTDADDLVTGFAVSLAPNGEASVVNVVPSGARGAPGSAEIHVPADASPGSYTATVTVSSGGAGLQRAACTFPINVAAATRTSSTAAARCTVPSVRNLTLAKARSRLKARRCAVGKVTRPKGVRKGLVVRRQSRKAGVKVKSGTKVNLTLGRKPAKKKKR